MVPLRSLLSFKHEKRVCRERKFFAAVQSLCDRVTASCLSHSHLQQGSTFSLAAVLAGYIHILSSLVLSLVHFARLKRFRFTSSKHRCSSPRMAGRPIYDGVEEQTRLKTHAVGQVAHNDKHLLLSGLIASCVVRDLGFNCLQTISISVGSSSLACSCASQTLGPAEPCRHLDPCAASCAFV